jgi:hypothetical protein
MIGIAFLGLGLMLSWQWVNGMTEGGGRVPATAGGEEKEEQCGRFLVHGRTVAPN